MLHSHACTKPLYDAPYGKRRTALHQEETQPLIEKYKHTENGVRLFAAMQWIGIPFFCVDGTITFAGI